MNAVWAEVLCRAEHHHGLVTRVTCRRVGLSDAAIDRRVADGALVRVFTGVYRVGGMPPTRRQEVAAAGLVVKTGGGVSHQDAASLLQLDAIRARPLGASVDVTVQNGSEWHRLSSMRFHRSIVLPPHHFRRVDGILCTSPARTICDLASVLDFHDLETAAESARRMGLMSLPELERTVEELGRRSGVRKLRRYVEAQRGNPALQYRLELKVAALLRRQATCRWLRQHPITVRSGRRYRVDFAAVDEMVALEAEGFRWHGNRLQWKHDRNRLASIEAMGWRVLQVTWDDVVARPEETLQRINFALTSHSLRHDPRVAREIAQ